MSINYKQYIKEYVESGAGILPGYGYPLTFQKSTFDSLGDFIESLENFRLFNKDFREKSFTINCDYHDAYNKWSGGKYADAVKVDNSALPGEIVDFSKAAAEVAEKLKDELSPAPVYDFDVAGESFDVGEVLSGRPEVWFTRPARKQKKLDIIFNADCSSKVKPEVIFNRGACLLGLLDALKAADVATTLQVAVYSVNVLKKSPLSLKAYDLRININLETISPETLRFIVCNPLFLRRLDFAWLEILSEKTDLNYKRYYKAFNYIPQKEDVINDIFVFTSKFLPPSIDDGARKMSEILKNCDFSDGAARLFQI